MGSNFNARGLKSILLVLLLADLIFSFYQNLQMPLDGDLAESVLPDDFVSKLLHDPFGLSVLIHDEYYPNPNRFFAHGSLMMYMRNAPLALQNIFAPVDSVYIAAAVFKTITQSGIIYLMALLMMRMVRLESKTGWIVPAMIIAPLFQTEGYNRYMGIIDQSVSYVFFYAFPFALLLLFGVLIFSLFNATGHYRILKKTLILLLAIILPFSSPLIPGVIIIVSAIGLFVFIYRRNSWPPFVYGALIFVSALSLYSLWLGTHNTSNELVSLTLKDRYMKLPSGLFNLVTGKPGWFLLWGAIAVNVFIMKRFISTEQSKSIIAFLKLLTLFSLLYILLLPLGGYREYRANIIRYDSFLPVTLGFVFYFGCSAVFIFQRLRQHRKLWLAFTGIVLLLFTFADKRKSTGNTCEKMALQQISQSDQPIVQIPDDCTVLSWHRIYDYKQSERNSELLQIWGITSGKKYYYQK